MSLLDVDLDSSGNLFVAYDAWASSTQALLIGKYNAAFALQTTFGGSGEADGQFAREMHLAVDATRALVYVSDSGHSKVQLFTLSGTYVNAWGTSGSGPMQFDGPAGIAVDPSGDVYVADEGNDRISKFSVTNGTATLAATWSAPQCHTIAIDTNGRVVVMATNDAKVLIYRRR
jgi:DNA-binding beta-propeller fold protein YncE